MLSKASLLPSFDRRFSTLAALQFALLCSPFAFVREPLSRVGGALSVIRDPITLVRQGVAPTVRRLFLIVAGKLPADSCPLPASGLPLTLKLRLGALTTLQLPLFRRPLTLVREPLLFVGCAFPQVRDPLTLVRDPLTLVRRCLAPGDCRLAFVETLALPLTILRQLLAS